MLDFMVMQLCGMRVLAEIPHKIFTKALHPLSLLMQLSVQDATTRYIMIALDDYILFLCKNLLSSAN